MYLIVQLSILDSFRKLQYDKLWEAELWLSFLVGCWEPPPDGWFKLNVDAAVDSDRGLVGFGAGVRNCHGDGLWLQVLIKLVWCITLTLLKLRISSSPLVVELDSFHVTHWC
ncbi:hypothetical protein WN944_005404 [Citrus x changshan-huyou]|uniref:RNase H type-1 domain-containing protein n=1 Tax=Citrus x changshan-huyou TaxID=2935761 RepID=A0AAP0QH54_9ROSI